jgi:hypothetical protein
MLTVLLISCEVLFYKPGEKQDFGHPRKMWWDQTIQPQNGILTQTLTGRRRRKKKYSQSVDICNIMSFY